MSKPPNLSADSSPAAIVLAAGISQRFGGHKLSQLLTIADTEQPVVVHTLRQWLKVFDHCFLVVRPEDQQLIDALAALPDSLRARVPLIEAEQSEAGMAFSLREGVEATSEAPGWVIGLADMPWVPAEVLQRVKQAIESGVSLVAPFYQGRRGHPAGFARQWYSQLMMLQGDKGARALLQQRDALYCIDCDSAGVVQDIDTPADIR